MRRIKHCWLIITGRIDFDYSTERMELYMALDNLNSLVASASAAADRLIAKAGSDEQALAQAQSDLAGLEAQAVAAVQPLADKISGAAPSA